MTSRSITPSVSESSLSPDCLGMEVKSKVDVLEDFEVSTITDSFSTSQSSFDSLVVDANSAILKENTRVLERVSVSAINQLVQNIIQAQRIFVIGEGRSGLVARMAAMRLMHLGYQVYVVGETITPAITEQDLLIACSGSGRTDIVCTMASKAKQIGAQLAVITTAIQSQLASSADTVIELVAVAKQDSENPRSQQFAGSLFEQSMLLLFDSIFHVVTQLQAKDTRTLWALHTNLE